jgi:hypoxanthine phosphoribosyltransferase
MAKDSTRSVKILDLNFRPYIDKKKIKERIKSLAEEINTEEAQNEPIFLVVMTGAFIFASDLLRRIHIDNDIRFIRARSYSGTQSTGVVKLEEDYLLDIKDRNIIIVEDIIDTGITLKFLKEGITKFGAKSIKTCSLLSKTSCHTYPLHINYCGFEIEDKFVVGYGLDYNDKGRNLKNIYQLDVEE